MSKRQLSFCLSGVIIFVHLPLKSSRGTVFVENTVDRSYNTSIQWLRGIIQSVMNGWEKDHPDDRFWREPLVACASADDPIFDVLRESVFPDQAKPAELLAGARTVIVFFLPFRPEIGKENERSPFFASRSWALAYPATNSLIEEINLSLMKKIEEAGHRATVTPATHNFDPVKLISRWSHKHLAYVAGLGTFGIHQQIITSAGCCGRLGSLVTTMPLPVSERPGREFCLEKAGQECGVCADRCAYQALTLGSFDRQACYRQCLRTDEHYSDLPLVDVCGKCCCEVPCSYTIPAAS